MAYYKAFGQYSLCYTYPCQIINIQLFLLRSLLKKIKFLYHTISYIILLCTLCETKDPHMFITPLSFPIPVRAPIVSWLLGLPILLDTLSVGTWLLQLLGIYQLGIFYCLGSLYRLTIGTIRLPVLPATLRPLAMSIPFLVCSSR